jgi:hypothetical protein
MDVGVFEEKTSDEEKFNLSKHLNSSQENNEHMSFSILQTVTEHRPPSRPGQRVILGASALRKLQFQNDA